MFFTQDDYKKIQQWLIKNSVKDTEFNEANIPFNGEETITIVQGNQNKKVFLKDLIAQVFNLGISDFVNITDKYDAPNISLEEAIRLIPSRARKEGQVITFLDREDHWHIYQFKGVLNQWNVLDTWEDLFDWEKLIIDSILPDEEDLTKSLPDANGNSYLSLKDREYNPNDFSGLGRVILRKNIVEIEDSIYGKIKKNYLYQDMFTQSNTVYEIRYDFDLNNQTITIPENCTLKYEGGSINNGHIVYQNTKIQGIESLNSITTEGLFVVIDAVSDEEDLHNNNGVLKFANREHNPNAFSGLGKIILRKNIVNGKNILTQDRINKENTIYEIRYDFDLNSAEITVPEGCVLDFQGGSLKNGNIDISNGSIVNDSDSIIFNNAYVRTNQIKTSWFDNVDFANLLNGISGFNSVVVEVDKDVYLSKGVSLCNNAHLFSKTNNKISHNYMAVQDNCLIDGITFDGASSISIGLWIKGSNVRISNCMFVNYKSQDNVTVVRCGNAEDSAPTIEQVFIENNIFDNFGSTNVNAEAGSGEGASRAIYVYSPSKDIYIRNNVFKNIIGEADSDYIFIMADNTLNDNEHFPSHTNGVYKFGSIPTIIDGNVFYDALVSSIKLQASDIIISNNKMICSKVNAKRGQYLLFRAQNCYNVNVINNSCHSKYRIGAIECIYCKDIVVDGCNIVMEEPSLMIGNLLDCYQSESLTLKNISVKAIYNNTSHWNNQSILHISGVRDFKAMYLDVQCDTIPTVISAYKDNIMGDIVFKNCKFRVTSRNDNYWILNKSSNESKLIIEDCDFVDDSTEGTSVGTWKVNNIYIPISITNSSIPKMSILNEAVISKSTINQDVAMFAEGALRIYDCNLKSSKVVTVYGGDLYVNGLNIDEISNFIFDIEGYNSVELHNIYLNKSDTLLYLENVCKTPNEELLSGIKWGKQRVPIFKVNFGLESQAPANRAADFEYECTDTGGFYKGANLATNKCNNTYFRPKDVGNGTMYFDTDLGKPIWWQGSKWVDATGADV